MVYDPTGRMRTPPPNFGQGQAMGGNPDMISRSLNSQISAMPLTGMNDPRQSVRGPGMMPGIAPGGSFIDRMRRGSLSDALNRMRERISQGNRGRPPGMAPGKYLPGGPGIPPRRSPGGPFGQGPTRRMPPQLDPSKGRAGMDRIMDLLRGTRNPMDRMSPDRTRGGRPNLSGLGSGRGTFRPPLGPMQPRPQDIQPEIRTMPTRQGSMGSRGMDLPVNQSFNKYFGQRPPNNKAEIFNQQIVIPTVPTTIGKKSLFPLC